jgi:hypothetical protein
MRVRAVVAHDSYERIVPCHCNPEAHTQEGKQDWLGPIPRTIDNPALVGVDTDALAATAANDDAIAEFSRFYLERREQEVSAAGTDQRKRRKLEDEFTPRLEMTLSGLEGSVGRDVILAVRYAFPGSPAYESELSIRPRDAALLTTPATDLCTVTGKTVPVDALGRCEVTGAFAMRHLLVKSEASGRVALPEFSVICALSGKRVLMSETEPSAVTNQPVTSSLLIGSAVSGKRAEPAYFGKCAFTGVDALKDELSTSEISGKLYRSDEVIHSAVSGRTGHKSEFIECYETRQPIALDEAERCDVTGKLVRKGVLRTCAETGKHALPSELGRCSETGEQVLKSLLVTSSVSAKPVIEHIALRASNGRYCAPSEAGTCFWSGRHSHPDDLRTCSLTGLTIHAEFATPQKPRLRALAEMLDGVRRTADDEHLWDEIAERVGTALKVKKCQIEAAVLSPAQQHLAVCSEIRTMLGIRVRHAGAIYDLADHSVFGRIAEGKRGDSRWIPDS